ncbi:MAG: hypothetical protein GY750_02940 [Lentisphaerae bacterium]|nr:hypothetical protein [Lentisphaerota bacterium]MCP4100373.1 hypothetical protein [Lentisphaerota bacterium]
MAAFKFGSASYNERREARLFAKYGKELSAAFKKSREMYDLLYNSGTKLKDIVVELPGRKVAKVASIQDGVISAKKAFSSSIIKLKIDDMKFLPFARFVKRTQKRLKISHVYFYYCLHTGNFSKYTAKNAPDGFWEKEIANFEYNYFKHKLRNLSYSERKQLRKEYGDLDSFKKADR